MVVSEFSPNSIIEADCFLVAVPLALIVVEVDEYWIITFVLSNYVCLYPLNASVPWCGIDDLVWSDDNAPRFGTGGRATSRLGLTKLSLMSPPRNVQ